MPFEHPSELLARVRALRKKLHISPVHRGNDKDRRRITIAVLGEYLRLGGDVDQAYFFENDMYHSLKTCNLSCDPLPEERRLEELELRNKRFSPKRKRVNPLKLVSEGRERGENEESCPLAREIIEILTDEGVRDSGVSRDNSRGGSSQTSRHIKECPRSLTKKKRLSLHKPHQI